MKRAASALAATIFAALMAVSPANAKLYKFTYDSFDSSLQASGEFNVNASGEVTQIAGGLTGLVNDTIIGMVANPNFSSPAYSPDGSFIYDNAYLSGPQSLNINGLLFKTTSGGGYWNLWGNSPTNYSLWESVGSYNYPVQTSGTFSVVAAPEPSTWLMMMLGFAALFAAARQRRGEPISAFAE